MLKTPPLQTATATIDTLCGRLQSATLLEDRRAAILGLRSFAKQYPASVASGSLRELITILRRDGLGQQSGKDEDGRRRQEGTGDVDTIRLVLETLLMLFNPDSNSPEAGEEIAFFMADEFSMRQDNITLLLSLLDPTSPYADYYARLYSLQLLSAICAARPERLQECILSAPLGVSRLVGMLDDNRDAVRNAGLLLLVDLTSGANEDLRKIVAFEDVFVKAFALIRLEGGLAEAGITAQDCLSLLANLLAGSSSNQTMFRESGCVAQLAELLVQVFPPSNGEAPFMLQSREKSAFGLLQLLRFFFVPGEPSTMQNQAAFFRAGTAQVLIDIGFSLRLPAPIRIASLKCVSELIGSNPPLQEAFAGMTVVTSDEREITPSPQQVNGTRGSGKKSKADGEAPEPQRAYIIEALLDLTLNQPRVETSLRNAGCRVIQAYLAGHDRIRSHFLQRAISGHSQREAAANVLSTLLQSGSDNDGLLFASWIVQDLIADDLEAKAALSAVKEGDENAGEDVLTFAQTLGAELEEAMAKAVDEMPVAAYASLLIIFLWDNATGVDDFLAESSSLLQLLTGSSKSSTPGGVRLGLAATLLGTVYEFSTKDSPISRRSVAPLLTQKLGRAKYLDALTQLRRNPAVTDLDLQQGDEGDILFCKSFVELFTVEYSRLRKAVDKDPGIEVLPSSAAEAGVDRDVLDDLRQQLQTVKDALAQAQTEGLASAQQHEQDRMSSGKELQSTKAEIERLQRINQSMQQGHETELAEVVARHERQKTSLVADHSRALDAAKQATNAQVQVAVREQESRSAERAQDYERRLAEIGNAHRAEQTGHANTRQQLETLTSKHAESSKREKALNDQFTDLSQRHTRLQRDHELLQSSASQSSAHLDRATQESEQSQSEIARLSAQVKDLKDELRSRDDELAAERAGFAELEKELVAAKSATSTTTASQAGGGDATAALEQKLQEAREGEKSAKEELESMLLVMGDIEAKRDAYREKVRELGGEVSEDDEDEDEEEEGEEGDEDDVD